MMRALMARLGIARRTLAWAAGAALVTGLAPTDLRSTDVRSSDVRPAAAPGSDVRPPSLLDAALVRAYAEHVSGDRAFDHVAVLSTLHRLTATAAFDTAAAYVAATARSYGLEVELHDYPADGRATFWTWQTFPRWEATRGDLTWVSPGTGRVASIDETPVSLAAYSDSADVTADVVDVGVGNRDRDYEGKDVRGKLVFANGFPSMVYQKAVAERGAAGIISWYNEITQPDAAAWLSLPVARGDDPPRPRTFAFVLSYFQGRPLKQALERGERVRLHAQVAAATTAGHYRVVSATIPGTDAAAGEVWFTAHLDHQKPGANDNASGSAALLEIARSLSASIKDGVLPRPAATIRFLWGPEMIGNIMFLHEHPALANRVLLDLNLDTVGEHQDRLGSSLWVIRPPLSRGSYAADAAENLALFTLRNNRRLLGGRPDGPFLTARGGTRSVMNGEVVPYVGASDHIVFDDGAIAIPALGYIHYPDPTWHTNADRLEYVDPTTLERVAFMTGATAIAVAWPGAAQFERLLRNTEMLADVRLARARSVARTTLDGADSARREHAAAVLQEAYRHERQTVESLTRAVQFAEADRAAVRRAVARLDALLAEDRARLGVGAPVGCRAQPNAALGCRRPARTGWKGPLDTYRNVLAARLGSGALRGQEAIPYLGSVALYEALNWADGAHDLTDIYQRVVGVCLIGDYPLPRPSAVRNYFDLLERAGLLRWQ